MTKQQAKKIHFRVSFLRGRQESMAIKGYAQDFEAELVAKRPSLFAYVRGIVRNDEIAGDITQEAMLRAHQRYAGTFPGHGKNSTAPRSQTIAQYFRRCVPFLHRRKGSFSLRAKTRENGGSNNLQ